MDGKAFSASLWILSATELQLGATIAPSEGSGAEDCLASFLPVIKDDIFPFPGERDLTATTSKEDLVEKNWAFAFSLLLQRWEQLSTVEQQRFSVVYYMKMHIEENR